MDVFVKFYDVLGHNRIIKSFGQSVILVNNVSVANSKTTVISLLQAASQINQAANHLGAGIWL